MKRSEHSFIRKTIKEHRLYVQKLAKENPEEKPLKYSDWLKKEYGDSDEKHLCPFKL